MAAFSVLFSIGKAAISMLQFATNRVPHTASNPFNTPFLVFNKQLLVFNAKFIIFNAKFIIFNAKFIIFNA